MHRCTSLLILLLWPLAATAVDFADYDYDRFSQTVTLCDRLAAHGRDPGHVAPAVGSATMDKPAAIEACHDAVSNDPDNPTHSGVRVGQGKQDIPSLGQSGIELLESNS